MSYPQQQPGGWSDPSWPAAEQAYVDPAYGGQAYGGPAYGGQAYGSPTYPGYPASGPPVSAPGYGYGYPVVARRTNGLAVASLVVSIVSLVILLGGPGIIGAIMGHVARRQIRQRGDDGDGMALAGIIVGWIGFAIAALFIAFFIFVIAAASTLPDTSPAPYST
jgi:hypothetical protein